MSVAYDIERDAGPTELINIEAEQALLGAILYRNDVLDALAVPLEPVHFSQPLHSRIYEAAVTLIRSGRRADPLTLKGYFENDVTLKEMGGLLYLTTLSGSMPSLMGAPGYAAVIHDLYLRRAGIALAEDAIADLRAIPVDVRPSEMLAGIAQEISLLAEDQGGAERTTFSNGEAATAAIDAAAFAYQNDGKPSGHVSTGIAALDEKIGGLVRGEMIIVGGRPSMGKTACGIVLAANAARAGTATQFISLEMRAHQLGARQISMTLHGRSSISYNRIIKGRFSEQEFAIVIEAAAEVSKWPMTIEDRSSMTVAAIASAVAREKVRKPGLGVVVVDYLGLIEASGRYIDKVNQIGEISGGLKRIAKQANVCLIALHQLSRAVESRDNKRPTLADLRDSGAIEQDADIVLFPFRESYYLARDLDALDPTSSEAITVQDRLYKVADLMEIIVAKNRQGSTGMVRAWCDMTTNVIKDIATADAPAQEGFL